MTDQTDHETAESPSPFKPLPLILVVLGIFLMISLFTNNYTQENSLHRYCDIGDETME